MPESELITSIFARPRMFSEHIDTFRDVVLFAEGVCHGLRPPHGADALQGFDEYLAERYNCPEPRPWSRVLLEQFGDLPLQEGCEVVCGILHDWQVTLQNRQKPNAT